MRRSSVRPTDRDCGLVGATASPPAVQLGARQAAAAHARTCRQAGREATRGRRAARATSIIPPASDTSAPSGVSEPSGKYTLASGRRSTTRNRRPRVSEPRRSSHPAPSGPRGARRPFLRVDIRIIAEALGHESLESTKMYTQVSLPAHPSHRRRARSGRGSGRPRRGDAAWPVWSASPPARNVGRTRESMAHFPFRRTSS
jgi:hypothetical protein